MIATILSALQAWPQVQFNSGINIAAMSSRCIPSVLYRVDIQSHFPLYRLVINFSTGIKTFVGRALQIQGIRTKLDLRNGEKNHDWKTLHGFRKFFKTQTERVMKSLNVEILMGHDILVRT
jgi:hypothetical protein